MVKYAVWFDKIDVPIAEKEPPYAYVDAACDMCDALLLPGETQRCFYFGGYDNELYLCERHLREAVEGFDDEASLIKEG